MWSKFYQKNEKGVKFACFGCREAVRALTIVVRSVGQLIMDVQREPVQISKSGKPVAVMKSAPGDETLIGLRTEKLRAAIAHDHDAIAATWRHG